MKMKWTVALSLTLVTCGYVIVTDRLDICRLRDRSRELECSRLALLEEMYGFSRTVPDANTTSEIKAIYADIAAAYTNEDLLSMYKGMARLPSVHDHLMTPVAAKVRYPFIHVLNESFLFAKLLRDFSTVREFDRYVTVGLAAARFYGETEMRRRSCDTPFVVEYRVLDILQKYRKKFHGEGRNDLAEAAERHREFWIARIESIDGLTRQYAWHTLKFNTIYTQAKMPERALSEAQGIMLARQTAIGLIRCGYTPKWLDVDFPLPQKVNANDGE